LAKIIAIANQKGGVGKTTTSINLSACIAMQGKKVLLIDLDPQGNATSGVGVNKSEIKQSIYEILINEEDIENTILDTQIDNLKICPSNIKLAGAEVELVNFMSRESRIKGAIESIQTKFDYIIIDCPPSLEILTTNALTAADSVIIPVQCEFFALEGIMQLLKTIMLAQKSLNPSLQIEGVLLTMLDNRTNLGLEVVEEVKGYFKERVYDTIIPRLVKLSEAPSHGKPIIAYDPRSRGTEAYINLAKEVIERNGN